MALGKAVVTTSRGADGLTVDGRQPPLVTADNSLGFSQAIVRLLSDETLPARAWYAGAPLCGS